MREAKKRHQKREKNLSTIWLKYYSSTNMPNVNATSNLFRSIFQYFRLHKVMLIAHAAVRRYMKSLNKQQFAVHSWWLNGNPQTNGAREKIAMRVRIHVIEMHSVLIAFHVHIYSGVWRLASTILLWEMPSFFCFRSKLFVISTWMASSVRNLNGSSFVFFFFDFHNLVSHILRVLCDCVWTNLIWCRFANTIVSLACTLIEIQLVSIFSRIHEIN